MSQPKLYSPKYRKECESNPEKAGLSELRHADILSGGFLCQSDVKKKHTWQLKIIVKIQSQFHQKQGSFMFFDSLLQRPLQLHARGELCKLGSDVI